VKKPGLEGRAFCFFGLVKLPNQFVAIIIFIPATFSSPFRQLIAANFALMLLAFQAETHDLILRKRSSFSTGWS
jgi:hypothetical protein